MENTQFLKYMKEKTRKKCLITLTKERKLGYIYGEISRL